MPSFLDDYVPVNERIDRFYEKYASGRITTEIVRYTENQVVMAAYVFRSETDQLPAGVGHSQMSIPGKNVARGAELETTETSAVGRALAMAGFEVKRSIASREEVEKNARDDETGSEAGSVSITPSAVPNVGRGGKTDEINDAQLNAVRALAIKGKIGPYAMTKHIADALGDELVLDNDPETAAAELREYLTALEADDAGKLITYLDIIVNGEVVPES